MVTKLLHTRYRLNDLERSDNGVQYLPAPLDTAAPTVTPGRTLRPLKPSQRGN